MSSRLSYFIVDSAKDADEAINKSGIRIGQQATVTDISVSANGNGSWTVIPAFKLQDHAGQELQADASEVASESDKD